MSCLENIPYFLLEETFNSKVEGALLFSFLAVVGSSTDCLIEGLSKMPWDAESKPTQKSKEKGPPASGSVRNVEEKVLGVERSVWAYRIPGFTPAAALRA